MLKRVLFDRVFAESSFLGVWGAGAACGEMTYVAISEEATVSWLF